MAFTLVRVHCLSPGFLPRPRPLLSSPGGRAAGTFGLAPISFDVLPIPVRTPFLPEPAANGTKPQLPRPIHRCLFPLHDRLQQPLDPLLCIHRPRASSLCALLRSPSEEVPQQSSAPLLTAWKPTAPHLPLPRVHPRRPQPRPTASHWTRHSPWPTAATHPRPRPSLRRTPSWQLPWPMT